MKIIMSPSKTQDFTSPLKVKGPMTQPIFMGKATALNNILKRTSKKKLSQMMHLDGQLLADTITSIKQFQHASPKHALSTYTGLVFKGLQLDSYGEDNLKYLNDHLLILSAQYGVLRPNDGICPYRLDMKMKPGNKNLYNYWSPLIMPFFEKEDFILDLSSNEFSKLVTGPKVTIGFREYKNNNYKNLATYAKMARGLLLHEMILRRCTTIKALKSITFDGYHYNDDLSHDHLMIFSRIRS